MARQRSLLPLSGPLGELSFYHHKDYGYLVRRKGGPKNGQLAPRSRENAQELGHASRTGKLIRYALRAGLRMTGDSTVTQRLTKVLSGIMKADLISARGQRNVVNGLTNSESREQLTTFAFTENRALSSVLHVPVTYSATDQAFTIAGFVPQRDLTFPKAATHVKMRAMTARIDHGQNDYEVRDSASVILALDALEQDLAFSVGALPSGEGFRIGAVGVTFLQEVNGMLVALQEGQAMGITYVPENTSSVNEEPALTSADEEIRARENTVGTGLNAFAPDAAAGPHVGRPANSGVKKKDVVPSCRWGEKKPTDAGTDTASLQPAPV